MCDERGTRRRVRWQALAGLRVRAGGSARRRRVALVVGAPRGAGHQRQDAASTPPKARKRRRDRDGEAWPRTLASPETVNHKTTTIGTTDIHTFRRWLSRLYTPPTESMCVDSPMVVYGKGYRCVSTRYPPELRIGATARASWNHSLRTQPEVRSSCATTGRPCAVSTSRSVSTSCGEPGAAGPAARCPTD